MEKFINVLAVIGQEIDWEVYVKPTYHIKPISLKIIDIWPRYKPKTIEFGGRVDIWA